MNVVVFDLDGTLADWMCVKTIHLTGYPIMG